MPTISMKGGLAFLLAGIFALFSAPVSRAQLAPPVGIRHNTPDVHALTNATIITSPGKLIEKGTVVIREGIVTAVGASVAIPADARVWDMSGLTVYPGFIDSYSDIGMEKKPERQRGGDGGDSQKPSDQRKGAGYWNSNVLSSRNADELFVADAKAAEKLRALGFTSAHVVPQKGIFRGTTALLNLGDESVNSSLVKSRVAHYITFESSGGDEYPNSLMGTIALQRQTLLDAQWHKQAALASAQASGEPAPEYVADLAALDGLVTGKVPVIFETTDELSLLRAANLAKEFNLKLWVRGTGSEYRRLDAVKRTSAPIILPVNFPEAPSVQTAEEALNVSLRDLRYWDEAPENPKKLHEAGIAFSFTTATLKDASSFLGNIRTAVKRGLPAEAALAALTMNPARLFGVESKLGSIEAGKMANIVVADGDLFQNEKVKIIETWVSGKRYEVKSRPESELRGTWTAMLTGAAIDTLSVTIKGEQDKLEGTVKARGKESKLTKIDYSGLSAALSFNAESLGIPGVVRMTGSMIDKTLMGTGELPGGESFRWSAMMTEPFKMEPDTSKAKPPQMSSFQPVYPPGEFGRPSIPEQPAKVLFQHATVWTSGPQGTLSDADVYVEKGKIVKVGANLAIPADALVVDAGGKHITAGLIDCHSHSAAAGSVNESGQAITAEVRIGDVVDSDDIGIYRELAGGLTAANILHGSANPIGGQNQVIKLRWGALPEEMKFEGALPGIKFALGENVKQSNWGDRYTSRYPQTRPGVEQIIRDEFRAALDYERTWKEYQSGKKKIPPRRDLQAETLLEIIRGKRIVHSHSYRQDEILMLIRVAEEFGFTIGTFQHVLEGYKVADAIAKHGAGASCFSDWWAYKMEVYDAIPYAGALMHNAGVVVSFNSDSDEQARRMNTEAAKAVKYGGVSEQEALKFVTLNPAKQLRVDHRVGSLEAGKDADLVVWSGHPLSTYAFCEQTWVDGRKYFDREEDRALNQQVQREKAVLIQKILGGKQDVFAGKSSDAPRPHFDDEGEGYSCHGEVEGKENR